MLASGRRPPRILKSKIVIPSDLDRGREYFQLRNYTMAIEYFNKVLALDPTSSEVLGLLKFAKILQENPGDIARHSRQMRCFDFLWNREFHFALIEFNKATLEDLSSELLLRTGRKLALNQGLRSPSEEFLELLLDPVNQKLSSDVEHKSIDKDKLFHYINQLQNDQLRQRIIADIHDEKTFYGKLFASPENRWVRVAQVYPKLPLRLAVSSVAVDIKAMPASAKLVIVTDGKADKEKSNSLLEAHTAFAAKDSKQAIALQPDYAAAYLELGSGLSDAKALPPVGALVYPTAVEKAALISLVDFNKSILLEALRNNVSVFLDFMSKPKYWKYLTSEDVDKNQLLDVIRKLNDKDLKRAVLRQALLPETFFNKIFANDQVEFAELLVNEMDGLAKVLEDEAIKQVFSSDDFRERLARQNPERYRELQLLLGDPVVVVTLASTAAACRALAVPLASVTHGDEPAVECPLSKREVLTPSCDAPAATASSVSSQAPSQGRVVVKSLVG